MYRANLNKVLYSCRVATFPLSATTAVTGHRGEMPLDTCSIGKLREIINFFWYLRQQKTPEKPVPEAKFHQLKGLQTCHSRRLAGFRVKKQKSAD
jgi:hypothetical protein